MADVKIYKIVDGEKINSFMSEKSWENLPQNKRGWMLADNEKKIEIPEEVLDMLNVRQEAKPNDVKIEMPGELDIPDADIEVKNDVNVEADIKEKHEQPSKPKQTRRRK